MTPAPTVLVLDQHPIKPLHQHIAVLQQNHVTVLAHPELQSLCATAFRYTRQPVAPWAIILAGSLLNNCLAARHLRGLFPLAGILALVDSGKETVLVHTLHSGADNYCHYSASGALFMASLRPLIARATIPAPAEEHTLSSVPDNRWTLIDRGWVLVGPQQQRIPLTTSERAFMTTLLAAPDLRASYQVLVLAIKGSNATIPPSVQRVRLTLLASRLRGKFRTRGCEAPFKSLHRWGYMFTAPVELPQTTHY